MRSSRLGGSGAGMLSELMMKGERRMRMMSVRFSTAGLSEAEGIVTGTGYRECFMFCFKHRLILELFYVLFQASFDT